MMSILDLLRWKPNKVNYRLDSNPQEFYSSQFDKDKIYFEPFRAPGNYQRSGNDWIPASDGIDLPVFNLSEQQARVGIEINGPVEFNISLPCRTDYVTPKQVSSLKLVLDSIVAMDSESRRHSDPKARYDEFLGFVEIENDRVHLHYFANTMNTEWGTYFTIQPNGVFQFDSIG